MRQIAFLILVIAKIDAQFPGHGSPGSVFRPFPSPGASDYRSELHWLTEFTLDCSVLDDYPPSGIAFHSIGAKLEPNAPASEHACD